MIRVKIQLLLLVDNFKEISILHRESVENEVHGDNVGAERMKTFRGVPADPHEEDLERG